jgi:multidrug efflux pump subunit AcrA (membrane-fusion protein)
MDARRRFGRRFPFAPILLGCTAFAAAGCSRRDAEIAEPVRPVKTMIATAGGQTQMQSFPGRVEASQTAELAFQVPGLLIELPVKEGQRVSKGI